LGWSLLRKKVKLTFDPQKFVAKVGDGKTVLNYRKNQIVFSQGEVADAVFYIQNGNIKLIVVSEQGKEAVVAILGPGFRRRPLAPRTRKARSE
jgi:CRP/FNR family transcriptional regulator, cyclic AMP receptor protein